MAVPPPPIAHIEKPALRAALRARRRAFVAMMTGAERARLIEPMTTRLVARLAHARCVAGYVAVGSELDPAPILAALSQAGVAIALPHVDHPDRAMRLLAWAPGEPLLPGPLGLRQPLPDAPEIAPDVFLAPLLGFDRTLARIGQGAGFYDRAFAAHRHALRIGLAWSVQEEPALPLDAWDISLHAVATEREWIER